MVRLVISDNEGSTTVVPLLRDEVTIGRKEGNTIRLTERNISRRHVQLIRIGGVYKLRDLDSYNGVLVNGRKVDGESALNNGDQIQLGDYTILVEEEAGARASAAPLPSPQEPQLGPGASGHAHGHGLGAGHAPAPGPVPNAGPGPASLPGPAPVAHVTATPSMSPLASSMASRRPAVPARLVMLTQPASGAEFVIPTDRSARMGRSDDVDCPINHRSVSREHAEVRREGDHFLIEDLGSANGVTVNGRAVKSIELQSGDIVELGQVVFRFVAAGEHYFFDPGEAARFRNTSTSAARGSANLRLAILLGAVTLAALVFIVLPTPDAQPEDPDATALVATADGESALRNGSDPSAISGDDGYDKAVLACRTALAATRFAEAAAHASMALKARPTAAEALDCKQRADAQSSEEQAYVRGKDALQRGEAEVAYQEFSRLPDSSSFRSRPEVAQAASDLARARLGEAQASLTKNRAEAARLAQSVLGLRGVTTDQLALAEQVILDARRGTNTSALAAVPAAPAPAPAARPAPRAAEPPPRAAPAPAAARTPAPAPAPARAAVTQAPAHVSTAAPSRAESGGSPMEAANACLTRGDNECVIRALEGNASTAQELGLLIETYRAVGDVRQAQRNMASYVQRFPGVPQSEKYRRMLEAQSQ